MNAPTSRTGNGDSPLSGVKNYSNVTLGKYSCLYINLSTRIGYGGSPLSGVKNYSNVTLGKYSCLYINLSTRIGYGGSPLSCGKNYNYVTLGHHMFFDITNYLHERGTAARRLAVQQ